MEKHNRICTESKETDGYDVAIIDGDGYTLYRGYKNCNVNILDEYECSFYLDRQEFEETLQGLHLRNEYNMVGYDPDQWNCFYTRAVGSEDLVDQIEIDEKNKEYRIHINERDWVTDGYDEFGIPQNSSYVSRFVFDVIVEGIKEKNFKLSREE